jgi:hypothetical protein
MTNDFAQPHNLVGVYLNHKVGIQALANHKETQELVEEKSHNPQGGSYGTALKTRALGFSVFLVQFMVRVSGWSGGAIYTRIIPPS